MPRNRKQSRVIDVGLGSGKKARSALQRRKELVASIAMKAIEHMTQEKKDRNFKELIPKIYRKEYTVGHLRNTTGRAIAVAFRESNAPEAFLKLLLHLEDNSDLLSDATYVQGLSALANHHESWMRSVEKWRVGTHNRDRQFSCLARHLLAVYDVPHFMDSVWFTQNETHQSWFKHIGAGRNIRTAPDIPMTLTKKMAHCFLEAPRQYTVEEALRWGQVHGLGGNGHLVEALRETRLVRTFENDDFWVSVIRFFIANPMLDVSHVNPIVDYIWNQKYVNRQVYVERGVAREVGPAQPSFSMKWRTPGALLRQVEEWHRRLGRAEKGGKFQWTHSSIGEFCFQEGSAERHSMKFWYVRELLSSGELVEEGQAMSHCVSTYARSCHAGRASIWTMEAEDERGRRKALTIEVSLSDKRIRQVRGKGNRLPTRKEKGILERWAVREGLELASYI